MSADETRQFVNDALYHGKDGHEFVWYTQTIIISIMTKHYTSSSVILSRTTDSHV